jgi:uncharacterized protein
MTDSLILAGASVRSLAESAVACGLNPYCVDMFADADLSALLKENGHPAPIRIDLFSEIPAAIEHLTPEIPLIWTGGLENHPHTLRQIEIQRPVFGTTSESLQALRSPEKLRSLVIGTGCRLPEMLIHPQDRSSLPARTKWLIKPVSGSGGLGIRTLESGTDVRTGEFCQQYIPGIPVSALYHRGQRVTRMLGACVQVTGDPALGGDGFRFCGTVGPVPLPESVSSVMTAVGRRIGSTEIRGIFGVDYIVGDDGIWLIEVNPRITASHEPYDNALAESAILKLQLASWSDDRQFDSAPSMQLDHDRVLARLIIYLKQDETLGEADVSRLLTFRRSPQYRRDSDCWIADIPTAGVVAAGQPFCSVYHSLRKNDFGWTVEAEVSEVTYLDSVLAGFAGLQGLDTATTAIRHRSLFENALLSDTGGR